MCCYGSRNVGDHWRSYGLWKVGHVFGDCPGWSQSCLFCERQHLSWGRRKLKGTGKQFKEDHFVYQAGENRKRVCNFKMAKFVMHQLLVYLVTLEVRW